MAFQRGYSGNPGGRPRGLSEVRGLGRQHTEMAINALVEICTHGKSEAARISAAVALLDRAWGKPTVAVEVHESVPDIGALILEAYRNATETLAAPMAIEAVDLDEGTDWLDEGTD